MKWYDTVADVRPHINQCAAKVVRDRLKAKSVLGTCPVDVRVTSFGDYVRVVKILPARVFTDAHNNGRTKSEEQREYCRQGMLRWHRLRRMREQMEMHR